MNDKPSRTDIIVQESILYARDLSKSEQRSLVLHLLYTMEMHDYNASLEAVVFQYERSFRCIIEYEDEVFKNASDIIQYMKIADEKIRLSLEHWKMERVSTIAKLILRYAIWEMDVKHADPALVINEAIELAKGFGEDDSYRFVHGILDSLVQRAKMAQDDTTSK